MKQRSVSQKTRRVYREHYDRFLAWCTRRSLNTLSKADADAALEKYLDQVFFDGVEAYTARCTVWGFGFVRDLDMCRADFPKAHRALKGWRAAAPEGTKEPAAWESIVVGADALASAAGVEALGRRVALGAARAALVQFDTYARPNEILKVKKEDLIPPTRRLRFWHVVLNPRPTGKEGDEQDLFRASVGVERAAMSKQRTFDNSVAVADENSEVTGRSLLRQMLPEWRRRTPDGARLFPLAFSEYEKAWRWASGMLALKTTITPHMLRHGGPSCDFAHGSRALVQIQERGQWVSLKSCQRYKKAGVYQQVVASLPAAVTDSYTPCVRRLPGLLRAYVSELGPRR